MKLALVALLLPSAFAAVKKTAANAKETAFLEEYAAGEGTQVTDSGLMYRVLKDGSGGSPELATPCSCHYEGRTATNYPSGKTFDSSYAHGPVWKSTSELGYLHAIEQTQLRRQHHVDGRRLKVDFHTGEASRRPSRRGRSSRRGRKLCRR
jgi:hypothetical protein